MLNTVTSSKTANPQSVVTAATSRKQSKIDRELIARHQLLSEQERVKRKRHRVAEQHRTVQVNKIMERYPTSQHYPVSRPVKSQTEDDADCDYTQIVARIYMETKETWRKGSHSHDTSASVSKSPSENSSERSSSPETEGTSCLGSDDGHITEALEEKTHQCVALESKLANVEQQLSDANKRHEALEQKYSEQRAQRINDKAMVDQWCNQVKEVDTYCGELEDARQVLEDKMEKEAEQHRNTIEAKDQEQAKLIAGHKAELEAMTQEAVQTQQELETKHREEMRVQIKSSKANRTAWEEARKAMEVKVLQMDLDYRDARQADEGEITHLTENKRHIEADNRMLTSVLNNVRGDALNQEIRRVCHNTEERQKELEKTRTQLKISRQNIENILEAMQQERDHWTAHREKETEAQAQVYDLSKQVLELQEKLTLRDNLLCAKTETEIASRSPGVGSLSSIALSNDELREELKVTQKENDELRAKASKVDNDNFDLCLKVDTVEEQLHEVSGSLKVLRQKQEVLVKDREFLFNAVNQHQGLTLEDRTTLQQHLRETTHCNQQLKENGHELRKELAEVQNYIRTVHDKAQDKIDETEKCAKFWLSMYWDEAVPRVEALLKEIADLKKELGREPVQIQERLERNVVVADRNALRVACEVSLRGVDSSLVPTECYEPGFHGGAVPATYDALRVLRPFGWVPLVELEKVWLVPMYKPYTEEDAAYRLEAQEQAARKAHREQMCYPPPPGTLVPYQRRGDHAEAHRGTLVGGSLAPSNPFRNVNAMNTRSTPGFAPTQARAISRVPKAQAAQRKPPKVSSQEADAPPYQSSWLQMRSELTREAYDDMDTDLKLDVLKMIGVDVD
ncbi:hypothetical protein DDE83_002279 [Stemphylium lycopersici]|uniref:Uncharacterized protein n=1 Tax=Stemphylium lycopersici TaxID=183478 RepID=A0A364NAH9_STELY|nr:hypothetical protein DDE83_002279 [Stemphylium lycopersici]